MEGEGGRQPLRSSGRAGDRVLGLQGKEDGAGGEWKREGQSNSGGEATHSFHAWCCADTGDRVQSECQGL